MGQMFCHDRPKKGRYRQFSQFDIEVIGGASPGFDAEVIEVAMSWLNGVGIQDLRLELNSIGDGKCRPAYLEKLKDYYRPHKSTLAPDRQLRLERNPMRLLDSNVARDQPFKAKAPKITDHLCDECNAHWSGVRRLLDAAGIEYQLDPYLVRGLGYYTRPVFEFCPGGASGQQDALASGGRYDGLAEAEGWPATPGVGFAGGIDRVVELMAATGQEVIANPVADVVVIPDGDLSVEAAEAARICRGVRSVAVAFEPRSLPATMKGTQNRVAHAVVLLPPTTATPRPPQIRDSTRVPH